MADHLSYDKHAVEAATRSTPATGMVEGGA